MTTLLALYKAPDHTTLIRQIAATYGITQSSGSQNCHRKRRAEMAQRVRLYRDDAEKDFHALIELVYETAGYQEKMKRLVAVASEQNVSRRIVDEVYSLYDKPAVRTLAQRDAEFHVEEKRLRLHEIMQELHRMLGLCNEVLVWQFKGVDDKTKLRVVTPDTFDAIPDPRDVTVMAGVLIDAAPVVLDDPYRTANLPCLELWDDTFRYRLNAAGQMVNAEGGIITEPEKHGLERIPGVLLHRREPSDRLLDPRCGRDITSAHFGVALLNLMIVRLSKSQGERQPILTGPLANMAKGQTMDGETPIVLPPEVVATMLETQTDPDHYLSAKKDKLGSIGQTYGLSYEQLTNEETQSASSGKSYQVRREKLTELRGEQLRRARTNEADVIDLMGFDADGMKVDHSEQAIPQDAVEEIQLLDLKMRMGTDSPIAYLKRKDPDLDDAGALALMKRNLSAWATLITMVRALNVPLDATAANPGNDPQINGSGKITQKLGTATLDGTQPAPGATAQQVPAKGSVTATQSGSTTR